MFRAAPLIFALLLAGCGFQPLYGTQAAVGNSTLLSQIYVEPIAERSGQLLRIELQNRLGSSRQTSASRYRLKTALSESKSTLAVRRDATATRANLTLYASFELYQNGTEKPLYAGAARSVNSYNILDSDFATLSAEQDAKRRAASDLATEITSRLGIFLRD